MPNIPMNRRAMIKAAATGGIAFAAGAAVSRSPIVSEASTVSSFDDATIAGAVKAPGSLTREVLSALYPVHRVWDPAVRAYPPRVPGALNIFFGPVFPGLLMDPELDYWANPASTSIGEVLAQVQNASSALRAAVRIAAMPDRVEFTPQDLAAIDNRAPKVGTLSPSANLSMGVPVLLFDDAVVRVAGRTWRTPFGWKACRVYIDWAHYVAAPKAKINWQVRIADYGPDTDLSSTTGVQVLSQMATAPAVRKSTRMLIAGSFKLNPAGREVRFSVARLSTTFGGSAGLIKLILERTA